MVDYQLIRYSSPVLDLHYNLLISTDKAFRAKDYKRILDLYHSTLTKTIERLGSDPQGLFSYDDFQQELKRCGNFGLLISAIMVPMCLTDPKNVTDLDEYSEQASKGESTSIMINTTDDSQFRERIVDLIDDFLKYDYYTKY